MNLSRLIPVPGEIERRAWECAYVLATEFGQRLTAAEFNRWACVAAAGPGATDWGWPAVGEVFRAYRRIAGVRV